MYRKTEHRQGLDESIPLKEGALLKYSSDGIGGFFKFSVWLIFQVPWSPHFSEPAEGIRGLSRCPMQVLRVSRDIEKFLRDSLMPVRVKVDPWNYVLAL